MEFEKIKKIIEDSSREIGFADYEIYSVRSSEMSVEVLNREVSAFSSNTSGGLCLRVIYDGKVGYASTELCEEKEVSTLAARAVENAKITEKLDTVGIFSGAKTYPRATCCSKEPLSLGELKALALFASDSLYEASEMVKDGTSSTAVSFSSSRRIANSSGLDVCSEDGASVLVVKAVVDKDGEAQSSYEIAEYKGESLVKSAAKKAVYDALAKTGATTVKTGKYDVIIDGKQMRSLLSVFSAAFSARSVLRGISLLGGKLGERVASEIVTLIDDPQCEGFPMQRVFDAEGVPTRKKAVIERGILKTYLHNRQSAKEMNLQTTANAQKSSYSAPVSISPYVFTIEAGELSEAQMLKKLNTGIYITEFKGLHAGANPTTGDFSLESAGFLVENGKITRAVKSFTLSGNFFELLMGIVALSDTVKLSAPTSSTAFGSPDVLLHGMSVAGD